MAYRYVGTPILTTEHLRAVEAEVPASARSLLVELLDDLDISQPGAAARETGDWFAADVVVQGHAGIGDTPVRLDLVPVPGVTIVTASNGVGKTSITHAIRQVVSNSLTSTGAVLPDNLSGAARRVSVGLVSGSRSVKLARSDAGATTWTEDGETTALPEWWGTAFQRHLPLLLYPEVATAIENPRELHEVLKSALNLDVLTRLLAAVQAVRTAAADAERVVKTAWKDIPDLAHADKVIADVVGTELHPDADRRTQIYGALAASRPAQRNGPAILPPIGVPDPELSAAIGDLRVAAEAAAAGSAELRDALRLLTAPTNAALRSARDTDTCPVCNSSDVAWADAARSHLERLDSALEAADAARRRAMNLLSELHDALPSVAPATADPDDEPLAELLADWADLRRRCRQTSVDRSSAGEIEALLADLVALRARRGEIAERLERERRRNDVEHAQIQNRVTEWLVAVEKNEETLAARAPADVLDEWIGAQIKGTREALFAPIADGAVDLWQQLNPDSDLSVTSFRIAGGAKRRQQVQSEVRAGTVPVAGEDALTVLSTGQRNALSLAVYFPRAAREISPFRFLILDDPIQAFDSSRVRLLAQLFGRLADRYQIVALTHDERLWQEVRAAHPAARRIHLERVVLNDVPVVEVKEATSPGLLMLTELADTLAGYDKGAPLQAAAVTALTLSCCRQALDAEVTTQILVLGSRLGRSHEDLRREIEENALTTKRLALLDQNLEDLGLQPLDRERFADTVSALNQGSHGQAPPVTTRSQRDHWQRQTRELIDLVTSVHL